MAKRKSKVGFLGLSNTTLLLIGGGIALYYLTRKKNESIGAIRNKKLLGRGKEHIVYEFEKSPNKVIKQLWDVEQGYRYDPNAVVVASGFDSRHTDMFLKYPELFATVYKVTNKYAIIERLNTDDVEKDEKYLYEQVKDFNYWEFQYTKDYSFLSQLYFSIMRDSRFASKILNNLEKNGYDTYLMDKYITFFKKINKTLKKDRSLHKGLDIGSHNLGYDINGNIKLLDY